MDYDYYDAKPVTTAKPTPRIIPPKEKTVHHPIRHKEEWHDDHYDFSPPLGGFVTLGADPEANGASGLPMDIALIPRDEAAHSEEITRAPPAPVLEGPEEHGGIPMAEGYVSEVHHTPPEQPIVQPIIKPGLGKLMDDPDIAGLNPQQQTLIAAGVGAGVIGQAAGDLYAKGEIDFGPGINLSGLGDIFDIGGSGNNVGRSPAAGTQDREVPFSEQGRDAEANYIRAGVHSARTQEKEREAERERIKALEEKTGLPLTTSSRARNILTSFVSIGIDTERNVRKKDWKDWRKEQGHSMLWAITGKRTGSRDSDKEVVRTIATKIFGEKGVENWRNIKQQQKEKDAGRSEQTEQRIRSTMQQRLLHPLGGTAEDTGGLFDKWDIGASTGGWPRRRQGFASLPSWLSSTSPNIAMDLADPGRTDSPTPGFFLPKKPTIKGTQRTPRVFGGEKGWTGKEKGAQDQTF